MMDLDFRTVALNRFLLFCVCTSMVGLIWRQDKSRFNGLGLTFAGFALISLGVGLIFLRGFIWPFFSVVAANGVTFLGLLLGLVGLKKFLGLSSSCRKDLWLWGFFTLSIAYFTYLDSSLSKRIVSYSVTVIYFSWQYVKIAIIDADKAYQKMTLGVGLVFAGYIVVSLLRIGNTMFFYEKGMPQDLPFGDFEVFFSYIQEALVFLWAYSLNLTMNKRLIMDLDKEKTKFSSIFNGSPHGMVLSRLSDGNITDANPGFSRIMGLEYHEIIGKNTTELNFWKSMEERDQIIDKIQNKGSNGNREIHIKHSSGREVKVSFFTDLLSVNKESVLLSTITDVTAQREMESKIAQMAFTDPLTGLLNRAAFSDRLDQALSDASRTGEKLSLLFLDLDRFKPVNDQFGHAVGDVILREATKRMTEAVGDDGTVGRIGGDEFVVLLPSQGENHALTVGEKIRSALEKPFYVEGLSIEISCSVGIAVYPDHGKEEIELSQNADQAMYLVKKAGGNGVEVSKVDALKEATDLKGGW